MNSRNRLLEALARRRIVSSIHQPRRDIAAICAVDFHQRVVPFIQLKQPPLCSVPVQIRHPLPHQRGGSDRNKHFQALHQHIRTLGPPANIKPQNSKGKRRIDRRLSLLRIHPQQRKGSPPLPHQPPRVNRPKGFLEVHARGQFRDLELRKVPLQSPAQLVLIRSSTCSSRRRRPPVAFAADFQPRRPRLPQSLHRQPQRAVLHFSFQYPPHSVPLRRPEMQQTAVVLARNRVLGLRQIKRHCAIFQHHGARGLAKKVLHRTSQSLRCHCRHWGDPPALSTPKSPPSVTSDHRYDSSVDVSPAR